MTNEGRLTRMLVRVRDVNEAACAGRAGADAVETDLAALPAVRAAFPRTLRLRIDGRGLTPDIVKTAIAHRVDEIAACFPSGLPAAASAEARPAMIARVPASFDALGDVKRLHGRVQGVMLEPEPGRPLLDADGVQRLAALGESCRAAGLSFGIGGGLEAPDIARLLLLQPDVLGFDLAVCRGPVPDQLDANALEIIRALIPRTDRTPSRFAAEAAADRVFVRDFVLPVSIGAYSSEHQRLQRVRFDVEVEVARRTILPRDMRDVFSYDIIIETLRMLAARGHVAFVENLAEQVAAALLDHDAVRATRIRVAKLDVIEGAVGIEIQRTRAP